MQTRISLITITFFLFACGQKTKPSENNVETKLDTATKPPKEVVQKIKKVNFPCSPDFTINKKFKGLSGTLSAKVTSVCLNDNAIVDTLQNSEERLVLAENSNYKHIVTLKKGNDSATYTITKAIVKDESVKGNEILVNPLFPQNSLGTNNNTVTLYFAFSAPNAPKARTCEVKVSLKEGTKFIGFVDEDKE